MSEEGANPAGLLVLGLVELCLGVLLTISCTLACPGGIVFTGLILVGIVHVFMGFIGLLQPTPARPAMDAAPQPIVIDAAPAAHAPPPPVEDAPGGPSYAIWFAVAFVAFLVIAPITLVTVGAAGLFGSCCALIYIAPPSSESIDELDVRVRNEAVDDPNREAVLQMIDQVRASDEISINEWVDFSTEVEDALRDGVIDGTEVTKIGQILQDAQRP